MSGLLKTSDFEAFSSSVICDGFFMEHDIVYVFIDLTHYAHTILETYIHDHHLRSPVRYALLHEIIDRRHVCGLTVSATVTSFFLTHSLVTQLYDVERDTPYETPIVAYVGKPTLEELNYVTIFGENARNRSAILGPYYYFTDFTNAFRQGGRQGGVRKGGMVRFALFMGATKYVENLPNDPADASAIKKTRLADPELDTAYELSTIKISDHDGVWARHFDSVYVARLEVEPGRYLDDSPLYVIKNGHQQVPLTYHVINTETLGTLV
ncbi:MAG: hypothetical protein ACOVRN_04880 [Flavobacterium sp.]